MNPQDQGYPPAQPPQNNPYPPQPNTPFHNPPYSELPPEGSAHSPNDNPLSVMQPGERVICEIKRHPIGMLGVYVMSGLIVVGLAIAVFGFAPNYVTSVSRSQVLEVGSLLFFVVALLVFGFVFVANKVYWGNRWVLTSDSITQITQTSLFDKQSSQLSLGNLEDVTVEQDGVLQHAYGFGNIRVETAGDRSKFVFSFCPNPNYYAKQILGAREAFEQGRRGEDEQRLYRDQGAYAQPGSGQYPQQPQSQPGQYQQPYPTQPPPQQPQTNPMPPGYGYGGDNNQPDNGVDINA